jgi:hypothetical protein
MLNDFARIRGEASKGAATSFTEQSVNNSTPNAG